MSSPGSLLEVATRSPTEAFARNGWILFGLAAVITLVRTYARWSMVGFSGFKADDFLVWLALVLYAGETVNDYRLVAEFKGLANDGMTDEVRAALRTDSDEYILRVGGSKLHLVAWPTYTFLLWSLKAAMGVFYLRLTANLNNYRRKINIGFVLIGVTFVVVTTVPFVSCIPTRKFWQISPDPGHLCYPESSPPILWTVLSCNIVTDAYLLWIPMPMLFHSTLPRATKAALMCLFGCGLFITVAAILRITDTIAGSKDFHAVAKWTIRETFIAILTTNLPCIFVLLRRVLRPYLGFLHSSRRNADNNNNNFYSGRGGIRTYGAGASSNNNNRRSHAAGWFDEGGDAINKTMGDSHGWKSQGQYYHHQHRHSQVSPPPPPPPLPETHRLAALSSSSSSTGDKAGSSTEHIVRVESWSSSSDEDVVAVVGGGHAWRKPGRKASLKRARGDGRLHASSSSSSSPPRGGIQKQVEIVTIVEDAADASGVGTVGYAYSASSNRVDGGDGADGGAGGGVLSPVPVPRI